MIYYIFQTLKVLMSNFGLTLTGLKTLSGHCNNDLSGCKGLLKFGKIRTIWINPLS
jgi:hypothetical protein